jgi:pre-mRNA-splicing factor ATP-dependent RNA helicase DHX16
MSSPNKQNNLKSFNDYVGTAADAEAFKQRLLKKDQERTRRKDGSAAAIVDEERAKLRLLSSEKRVESLNSLREQSRQRYLAKREETELKKLELKIEDEERLFKNENLTADEKQRLEIDKELLAIAKKRRKLRQEQMGYYVPGGDYDIIDDNIDAYNGEKNSKNSNDFGGDGVDLFLPKNGLGGSNNNAPILLDADKAYNLLVNEEHISFISDAKKGKKRKKKKKDKNDTKVQSPDNDNDDIVSMDAKTKKTIEEVRKSLPIYEWRKPLLQAIQTHQTIIVVAETGSGKTTQIPQYLHEVGYSKIGKIGCTQPRRVAAMSVAARVATEMKVRLGSECGYSIRFEDCTNEKTVVKYMTDGMLLREFLSAPDLKDYVAIMIDEAHERTLHTDILFGLIKDIARFRDDIKIIISSATLDAAKFSAYFDNAPIFNIPGRRFLVDTLYCKAPEADYLDAVVVTALQIHVTQPPGDILVFCTGQQEIEDAAEDLRLRTQGLGTRIKELIILPIYASLPSEEQAKIFLPPPKGGRKIILGTNIAETSLTIDGIKYVIDTGFCKQKSYNPRTGMESLVVTPISQAAADQRSGRAGRTSAGKCFRLYTKIAYKTELPKATVPEIQRTNLCNVVLMLKSLGIDDLLNFDFMDPPPNETLAKSFEKLYALGAFNHKGQLTRLGRRMAEFPTDPQLSKMLIASERYNCTEECLTIAAMLDVSASVFYRPKGKKMHADNAKKRFALGAFGDHQLLLNCYDGWIGSGRSRAWCYENYVQIKSMKRARDIRSQLLAMCDRVEVNVKAGGGSEGIAKAITSGFFFNSAHLQLDGTYKTFKLNNPVNIHPSSCLFQAFNNNTNNRTSGSKNKQQHQSPPEVVVFHELVFTNKEYIRQVSKTEIEWLYEIAPHYYKVEHLPSNMRRKGNKRKKIL